MQKMFLVAVALAGLTAVALGAFGAHGLKPLLDAEHLNMWEKGVQYQIYHALAIFMCYLYLRKEGSKLVRYAGICFMLGILCFSGSLYLLSTRALTNIPTIILGPITPVGGFFFIIGWGLLLVNALQENSGTSDKTAV